MQTLKLNSNVKDDIKKASDLIKSGEVVAIPTETVYGLGANALDESAVSKIFIAKGRPQDNPLIVHIDSIDWLYKLSKDIPNEAFLLAEKFWPGALTLVLKKSDIVPSSISRGLDTVAVRFPSHKIALEVIKKAGVPIAAPSANTSGRPSTTNGDHVLCDLDGKISAILYDEQSLIGLESTVLDLTKDKPILLRPGGITKEQIEASIGEILVDDAVTKLIDNAKKVNSPGMKYKHYAPKAELTVLLGSGENTVRFIEKNLDENTGILCFDEYYDRFKGEFTLNFGSEKDFSTQAHKLFANLRAFDELSVKKIYAQCPKSEGLGLAISNRIKKAAGFNILDCDNVVLGLTGASGSGKSTVSKILSDLGAKILDADKVYADLLLNHTPMIDELSRNFDVLENGKIDRRKLADIVFNDKSKLVILNEITHKYVIERFLEGIKSQKSDEILVLDVPLLFESGISKYCKMTIGVVAQEEAKLERIIKRDNISKEQAILRLKNQKPNDFYIEKCDIILENNKDISILEEKCNKILRSLK